LKPSSSAPVLFLEPFDDHIAHRIGELREQDIRAIDVRLFDRGSQGAELTAYGEVLLRCGINVFDEMRQGLRSLEYLSDPNSGEVRLGCTDIILHSLMPAIVQRFSKQHPGVQLDIKLTNPGEHQIQELRERKIDLLITRATGPQDDFHSEKSCSMSRLSSSLGRRVNSRESAELLSGILLKPIGVLPPYDSAPGALRCRGISSP
jgi:DNA-binding transcriptional LysR family regulator